MLRTPEPDLDVRGPGLDPDPGPQRGRHIAATVRAALASAGVAARGARRRRPFHRRHRRDRARHRRRATRACASSRSRPCPRAGRARTTPARGWPRPRPGRISSSSTPTSAWRPRRRPRSRPMRAAPESALVSGVPRQRHGLAGRAPDGADDQLPARRLPADGDDAAPPCARASAPPAASSSSSAREAYAATGGHGAVRASLHDGVVLPRRFRQAGYRTDLVAGARPGHLPDVPRLRAEPGPASRRTPTRAWRRPRALPVWTLLLVGGHVLPWLLLAGWPCSASAPAAAAFLAFAARPRLPGDPGGDHPRSPASPPARSCSTRATRAGGPGDPVERAPAAQGQPATPLWKGRSYPIGGA